jgi:hypothetical protein
MALLSLGGLAIPFLLLIEQTEERRVLRKVMVLIACL